MTEAEILDALRACFHPQIPLNIVDLGLVEHIDLFLDSDAPGAQIPGVPPRFRLTLTMLPATQDEAAQAQLSAQVYNRLAGLSMLSRVELTLLDSPGWTSARITPAGRVALNLDRPHFPILNNRLR